MMCSKITEDFALCYETSLLIVDKSGARRIGQVVRIWDLQKKRCIKMVEGHTNTITGAMYNCKNEHLAPISLNRDLILHNLTPGAMDTELKDPNKQYVWSRITSVERFTMP